MHRVIGTSINNIFHSRNVLVIDFSKGEKSDPKLNNIL